MFIKFSDKVKKLREEIKPYLNRYLADKSDTSIPEDIKDKIELWQKLYNEECAKYQEIIPLNEEEITAYQKMLEQAEPLSAKEMEEKTSLNAPPMTTEEYKRVMATIAKEELKNGYKTVWKKDK